MAVFRKNGAWWIDYYYQGQRYRQRIGTRRRDAEEALSQIKVKAAAGEFVPPDERQKEEPTGSEPVLFAEFAHNEYLPWSETQHARSYYIRQVKALRAHLIPYFNGKRLHEVTPKMVEDYKMSRVRTRHVAGKRRKPVTKGTVNRELTCLKVLFRKAVEWGRLEENPARDVKVFKETPKSTRLLEADEIARLLQEMPDHLKALVACGAYAGLRCSELFHLQWKDIDWKMGELHVVSRAEHHTKNYKSRRIPMNDELQATLQRHPARVVRDEEEGKAKRSPYVFASEDGNPYTKVTRSLNSAARQAGIEGRVTLHQLRHAFCSHALMQGIDPRTVQKWMDHKDLKTTLRYAHVSPQHEKAAIQRLRYESSHYMDTETAQS